MRWPRFPLGDSKVLPHQMRYAIPLGLVWGLVWGLLPVGHARKTSKGWYPGSILIRCPNHLRWLLSMHKSSGSTLNSKLCTLSLRLSPATLQKKKKKLGCFYPQPHSFSHSLQFMTIGQGWNIDWLVNRELFLPAELPVHYSGLVLHNVRSTV